MCLFCDGGGKSSPLPHTTKPGDVIQSYFVAGGLHILSITVSSSDKTRRLRPLPFLSLQLRFAGQFAGRNNNSKLPQYPANQIGSSVGCFIICPTGFNAPTNCFIMIKGPPTFNLHNIFRGPEHGPVCAE